MPTQAILFLINFVSFDFLYRLFSVQPTEHPTQTLGLRFLIVGEFLCDFFVFYHRLSQTRQLHPRILVTTAIQSGEVPKVKILNRGLDHSLEVIGCVNSVIGVISQGSPPISRTT